MKGRDFYQQLFGWTVELSPEPEMAEHPMFAADGVPFADIAPMPTCGPSHWATYVVVENVESTSRKATALGAQLLMPKTEVPNTGWFCLLQDPAGVLFYLWQPARAEIEPTSP